MQTSRSGKSNKGRRRGGLGGGVGYAKLKIKKLKRKKKPN